MSCTECKGTGKIEDPGRPGNLYKCQACFVKCENCKLKDGRYYDKKCKKAVGCNQGEPK